MNKSLRELGFTDEQLAALEKTGGTVLATCGATARATAEYAALRLSDAEVAAIRASNTEQ
jgi:hypothetical protein